MKTARRSIAVLTALMTGAFAAASPAAAQDKGGDRVNMVIAYSEDECPEAQEGEIVVCEILVEAERFRIPKNLRNSDNPRNISQARKVEKLKYVGDFGAFSCSPTGAGGFTGCNQKFIEAAYQEKDEAETVRFAQLIEQARQERLGTIDADAAEMQERVEQIEREYLERLERERAAPLPGEAPTPAGEAPSLATPPVAGESPAEPTTAPKQPVIGPPAEDDPEG